MLDRIRNSATVFWTFAVLSIAVTGINAFIYLYEYFNIGVFKNLDGYPFGHEGPVAGIEYYKSADLYAKHMLTSGLILLSVFALTLFLIVKHKTIGLFFVGIALITWSIFSLVIDSTIARLW